MKKSKEVAIKILKYFCIFLLVLILILSLIGRFTSENSLKSEIFSSADKFGIDRALVFAVIKVESDFNQSAVSSRGAVGLMQITPVTFDYVCTLLDEKDLNIDDYRDNIYVGCAYLNYLFKKFVTLKEVLCAYNAGEGTVSRWLKSEKYSSDYNTLDVIPYRETAQYVKKIDFYYKYYGAIYE